MDMVRLRNGNETSRDLAATVMLTLSELWKDEPILACELIMKCRDPQHKCFDNTAARLTDLSLIEAHTGQVNDCVREIVLCAVEGEEMAMKLQNPVAPSDANPADTPGGPLAEAISAEAIPGGETMDKRYQQLVISEMERYCRRLVEQQNDDPKKVWEAILRAHAAIGNEIAIRLSDALAEAEAAQEE